MTGGGGQSGESNEKEGVRKNKRRSRGGAEDREQNVDMCFCQLRSSGCCVFFQLLSISEYE